MHKIIKLKLIELPELLESIKIAYYKNGIELLNNLVNSSLDIEVTSYNSGAIRITDKSVSFSIYVFDTYRNEDETIIFGYNLTLGIPDCDIHSTNLRQFLISQLEYNQELSELLLPNFIDWAIKNKKSGTELTYKYPPFGEL